MALNDNRAKPLLEALHRLDDALAEEVAVRWEAHEGQTRPLHKDAKSLLDSFVSHRISWVPREMNVEADRLVKDALGAPG